MKKLFTLFTLALLAAFGLGGGNVALAATTIYERGTSTSWSASDISVTGWSTGTIENGLKQTGTNTSYSSALNLSLQNNSIIKLTASLNAGTAPGRPGSYDFIKLGGVSLCLNGQDKLAYVDIDGTKVNCSGFTRGGDYHVEFEINTATGNLSYTISGCTSASGTSRTSTDVTNVEVGHYKAGREGYQTTVILKNIEIQETVSEEPVPYQIKYVCGSEEVKTTAEVKGMAGNSIQLTQQDKTDFFNSDNTKKYIYVSDDSEGKIISKDELTVVTINFREAATYSYSLVSDKGAVLKSGSDFEGETLTIGYPRYYLNKSDSVLVEAAVNNQQYNKSFTLDTNNKEISVAYNKSSKSKIAFYTEGEDIAGVTTTTYQNIPVRASKALAATTSKDVYVTSLPAGKYKIHVGCFTSAKEEDLPSKFVKLALGDRELKFGCTAVNLSEVSSEEIAISKTTQLVYLADGSSNNSALDYLYIEKTGNVVESNGEDFIPGDGPTYDPDKAPEGGIESATRPEHGMATSPSDTTQNDNTNGTATGINGAEAEAQIVSIVNVNGAKVNSLQKGINIVTYSNGKRVKVLK